MSCDPPCCFPFIPPVLYWHVAPIHSQVIHHDHIRVMGFQLFYELCASVRIGLGWKTAHVLQNDSHVFWWFVCGKHVTVGMASFAPPQRECPCWVGLHLGHPCLGPWAREWRHSVLHLHSMVVALVEEVLGAHRGLGEVQEEGAHLGLPKLCQNCDPWDLVYGLSVPPHCPCPPVRLW